MFSRAAHKPGAKFIYGIFGVQYSGDEPAGRQLDLIKSFDALIDGKAHLDRIVYPTKNKPFGTQIWLSYWHPETYSEWWASRPVQDFWNNLPDDAGVWREILTVDVGRTQNACTADLKNGVNGLGEKEMFSEKIGYWGCLRDRLAQATADEKFSSPLAEMPERVPESEGIRRGRTSITKVPDNICFLVEGQDHSAMTPTERTYWFEEFDELVTGWMHHLGDNAAANGLLDVRMGYVPENGRFRDHEGPVNLNHNRKIELFYWMDMSKFERAGRVHRGHVKLRKKWMEAYCPVGPMGNGVGKITLWEETSILKGGDVQAEYIGCREGTGFMAYDGSAAVQSTTVAR
ncbi:Phenylacetaldoxime dehydratase [Colletotrichum sp. SAR 10_76]|nr:Phenylacetaldoxime dehydratase [Colletotrichum sp. SAR 10_76]